MYLIHFSCYTNVTSSTRVLLRLNGNSVAERWNNRSTTAPDSYSNMHAAIPFQLNVNDQVTFHVDAGTAHFNNLYSFFAGHMLF